MEHSKIIQNAGGIKVCSEKLAMPYVRVAAWKHANSIPSKYWGAIVKAKIASLKTLAKSSLTKEIQP